MFEEVKEMNFIEAIGKVLYQKKRITRHSLLHTGCYIDGIKFTREYESSIDESLRLPIISPIVKFDIRLMLNAGNAFEYNDNLKTYHQELLNVDTTDWIVLSDEAFTCKICSNILKIDAYELCEHLISKGFEFDYTIDNFLYFFKKKLEGLDFLYCLIPPHEGNGFKYLFRANAVNDFNKWSDAYFQAEYSDKEDFKEHWNEYLFASRCGF